MKRLLIIGLFLMATASFAHGPIQCTDCVRVAHGPIQCTDCVRAAHS